MVRAVSMALLLAGTAFMPAAAQDEGPTVIEIKAPDGRTVARAMVYGPEGVNVRIQNSGLAAGIYAAHVHDVGRCEGPAFESAGPHWNPTARRHGLENPAGPHNGDLPNLVVPAEGGGRVEFNIEGAYLSGGEHPLFDADGAAIVIHAAPDDHRTDPSGNSGARIACGVLVR